MAPAPLYKDQPGAQPARRAATGPWPIIPAIPLPLQPHARRQHTTTSLGSPIPRHLADTPAQTPRNGTPDPSRNTSNALHTQVPPTPASTSDSAIDTVAHNEATNIPVVTGTAIASEIGANGDSSTSVQSPSQHDSSASRSATSDDNDTRSAQFVRTPPPSHYRGHMLFDPPNNVFTPPYLYTGNDEMVRVMLGFGRHRERGFAIDVIPGVSMASSMHPTSSSNSDSIPSFYQEVKRIPGPARLGIFEIPQSIIPPLHPVTMGPIEQAGSMLVEHARRTFMQYETADCIINFYLSAQNGDQIGAPDIHLPGHRFVFSLSPTLLGCLAQQPAMQVPTNMGGNAPTFAMPTWSITLADPNLTRAALSRALQVLYGFSILEPAGAPPPQGTDLIVAGFHLQLPKVMWAGVDLCMYSLTWKTIEQVMSFGLTGATGLYCPIDENTPPFALPFARFEYSFEGGEHIRRLLGEVVAFMAIKFPADFKLDRTGYECQIRRIPDYPNAKANLGLETATRATSASSAGAARSARGHRATSSMASHDPRLSAIRFGDLSLDDEPQINGGMVNGVPLSKQTPDETDILLSRLLINMPFDLVKQMLEHPQLCQDSGGIDYDGRGHLIECVLAERERRRFAARHSVLSCRVPIWDMILVRLSQSEPPFGQPGDESWDALGWRECYAISRETGPTTCRTWEPLIQ